MFAVSKKKEKKKVLNYVSFLIAQCPKPEMCRLYRHLYTTSLSTAANLLALLPQDARNETGSI